MGITIALQRIVLKKGIFHRFSRQNDCIRPFRCTVLSLRKKGQKQEKGHTEGKEIHIPVYKGCRRGNHQGAPEKAGRQKDQEAAVLAPVKQKKSYA